MSRGKLALAVPHIGFVGLLGTNIQGTHKFLQCLSHFYDEQPKYYQIPTYQWGLVLFDYLISALSFGYTGPEYSPIADLLQGFQL
ncbi:hypothetical protein DM02DRAFT_613687 [Periconia macrospinosa]|uniref:Uncharacterized protein n=1 Tax=Periconia macrospinosa TaxID=97972 RepID=A0A2V1DT19_9PLEO|nr:hypothetical protein DM02DRAFT_613687 [Periconia macrospinosa]